MRRPFLRLLLPFLLGFALGAVLGWTLFAISHPIEVSK